MYSLCYVKYYENTDTAAEVTAGNRPVLFLAGSVPYLELDYFIIDSQKLLAEFNTDCVLGIVVD